MPSAMNKDRHNQLLFLDALIEKDEERVTLLKEYSSTVFGTDQSPALVIAAVHCSRNIIEILMKNGANPRCVDNKGRVPILVAAASGNSDCLKKLLDQNIPVHYSFFGKPLLQSYATLEDEEVQMMKAEDQLMESKAFKLPLPQVNYRTPLHEAALIRNSECVKLLVEKVAKVNFSDCEGNTALHLAIGSEDVNDDPNAIRNTEECIYALLNGGANLCALNKNGHSPLDLLLKKYSSNQQIKVLSTYFYEQMSLCKNCDTDEKYILLNFKSLCPNGENTQTKVLYELMEKLDKDNRRKLFQHPLLWAFVRYKWLTSRFVFYLYVAIFILYVLSLSAFVTFAHCDIFYILGHEWRFKTAQNGIPIVSVILLLTSILVGVNLIGLSYVFKNTYRWTLAMFRNMIGVIFTFTVLICAFCNGYSSSESKTEVSSSTIVGDQPSTVEVTTFSNTLATEGSLTSTIYSKQIDEKILAAGFISNSPNWVINITAIAVFLAWVDLMLLIGRFPKWAAQALLFGPVFQNVLRIFVTYGCLIIGFSFVFFLLFRKADSAAFGDPLRAIMKTIVMMTGEIDYMELFKDSGESGWNPSSLPLMARLAFLGFVVTATIALMNLILALAVSDTQQLIRLSKENQLMQLAYAMIHWEYLIESIEESKYTPGIMKEFLRRKFYIPVEIHYYFEKSNIFPSDLKQLLKSVATKKSDYVSPAHWNKVENLFCAILDLIECDEHGSHDVNVLRLQFDMFRRMQGSQ